LLLPRFAFALGLPVVLGFALAFVFLTFLLVSVMGFVFGLILVFGFLLFANCYFANC